jgi:hypothetical protein
MSGQGGCNNGDPRNTIWKESTVHAPLVIASHLHLGIPVVVIVIVARTLGDLGLEAIGYTESPIGTWIGITVEKDVG